jgi:hypothetical protein
VPFCANCGAHSDEPVERCPNCRPAEAPLAVTPAVIAPPPAIASPQGKLLAGCLAVFGGVLVGSTLSAMLFFTVAGLGGAFTGSGSHGRAGVLAVAVIVVGLIGIVLLARSGKTRDVFLQVFLVSTLITTLGVFATCSTLFWALKT